MTRLRYLSSLIVLLVTTVLLVLGYAAFGAKTHKVLAQGILPAGSYAFQLNGMPQAPGAPLGVVGVINFDGAGGVTGSVTIYDAHSDPPLRTDTFTGTHSSNPDGTGIINIVGSMGDASQFAMAMSNSNQQAYLLRTDLPITGPGVITGVATKQ